MVAVGPSPYSLELVRRTRRIAYLPGMPAGWLSSIEPARRLSDEEQRQLDKNLALARELGAEVVFTRDDDIARALLRVAQEHHVTQLVIGKPRGPAWKERLRGGSLLEQLMRAEGPLDIQVISPIGVRSCPKSGGILYFPRAWSAYGLAFGGVLAATALNYALTQLVGYWSLALVYLLAILLLGLRLSRGPLLLAADIERRVVGFPLYPASLHVLHRTLR